jgi:hypothetical protein
MFRNVLLRETYKVPLKAWYILPDYTSSHPKLLKCWYGRQNRRSHIEENSHRRTLGLNTAHLPISEGHDELPTYSWRFHDAYSVTHCWTQYTDNRHDMLKWRYKSTQAVLLNIAIICCYHQEDELCVQLLSEIRSISVTGISVAPLNWPLL